MNIYRISSEEISYCYQDVEANSPEEAELKFYEEYDPKVIDYDTKVTDVELINENI